MTVNSIQGSDLYSSAITSDVQPGNAMGKEAEREVVYWMPYGEWVARHQTEDAPAAIEACVRGPREG